MNHSTPDLPVHHQLLEFTQTHAHWVGDAIQPSHPLLSPSVSLNVPYKSVKLSNYNHVFFTFKLMCIYIYINIQFSSVQLLSHVWLFATQWTVARQASLSITNSWSLLKLMPIESVMSFHHLILCHPLLLLPSTFPSIRVFSSESVLHIRWPKYWSFSFRISPSSEYSGLVSFRIDWLDLLAV